MREAMAWQEQQTSARLKEAQAKLDEAWGAANYRLKYLDHVGRSLGRPFINGESEAAYASELSEIVSKLAEQAVAKERRELLAMWHEFTSIKMSWRGAELDDTRRDYLQALHARLANPASAEKGAL
jgi:hypothetical protein